MTPNHHRRGVLLFEARRHALAAEAFREALKDNPFSAPAHDMLARCHLNLGQHHEALEWARRAVELAPDWCRGHESLAHAEALRGRSRAALRAAEEALRLHPDGAEHHAHHAELLGRTGRWRASLEAAERGLALDPAHLDCRNQRALALEGLGRTEEQLEVARDTLALAPEDPTAHAVCGWRLLDELELPAARGHLEEALRQAPDYDWAQRGLQRLRRLERSPVGRAVNRSRRLSLTLRFVLRSLVVVALLCLLPEPWGLRCLGFAVAFGIVVLPGAIVLELRDRSRARTRR